MYASVISYVLRLLASLFFPLHPQWMRRSYVHKPFFTSAIIVFIIFFFFVVFLSLKAWDLVTKQTC